MTTITKHPASLVRLCLLVVCMLTTVLSEEQLLWSDEFDIATAENQPRTDTWSFDTGGGGWGNGELQVYTDTTSNVLVQDGFLKIIARKDGNANPPTFTSGRIKTEGKVSFKYGNLEARIKVPDVDAGLWPALWTMGASFQQVGWPKAGEIDIMEIGQGLAIDAGLANNRVVSAAHWENYEGNYATTARWYDSPTELSQGFHVYRLEWTPERIATFVDGILIWDLNLDNCLDCEELHQPHFILLNLAVGGGFTGGSSSSSSAGGSSSSSCAGSSSAGGSSSSGCPGRGPEDITATFPGEMIVDWIRLYDNSFTEVVIPSTPAPTPPVANPQTYPPTNAPTQAPVIPAQTPPPTQPPTQAPVEILPLPQTPPPTQFPTKAPITTVPRQPDTVSPTTLAPRPPSTLPPRSRDSTDSDDNDDDDFPVDCSSSRSGSSRSKSGKAGKGGKGGKGGSSGSASRSRSGYQGSGKGGRRRNLSSGSQKGKGSGKGRSKSQSRSSDRVGCGSGGTLRVSQLQAAVSSTGSKGVIIPSIFTFGCFLFGLFVEV